MSITPTILAVDDTPESLALLVDTLSPEGYRVRPADSGELALAAVAASPPDLILLDVRMRGMGGLEVLERLEAAPETQRIPVILISAFADTSEWVQGLQLGAVDYVSKPFRREELLTRVRTHLALRLAEADLEQHADSLRQANEHLQQEIAERQRVAEALQRSLERAERSRRALLSALEDQKRAQAERERLEEQLRASQKLKAIGSLAGGVAHDFNNLLSVILSYTEFAIEELPEGSSVREDLIEVRSAGERATVLTRQLLAFSRKQVLRPVALDLNQVAVGVEKLLRRVLGEDIDYVQDLAPDLGVVLADPGQVEQVLMNLVINARDAMPHGGKLTIETANVLLDQEYAAHHLDATPGPYVRLVVTDTGSGMDERTRSRLFEPFFTTKEKGKGTGLGLATVYGIVKQSGGNIWVYSEPGKGTTFKIYLPRALGTKAEALTPSKVPRRLTGYETILLVEDEQALKEVAARSLTEAGYTVLMASDGEEALEISGQHAGEIQLLLTDVVMPRMGGRVLAERLAQTRPEIAVLYTSGYTDNAIVHHGVLDPGMLFLPKPFTAAELARKVRQALDVDLTDPAIGDDDAPGVGAPQLDREALRALAPELIERLRGAAAAARFGEIVAISESLRPTDPTLADGLRGLAERFDYAKIRELLG